MTPDRWKQVSRIYGAVLTKPETARGAALAELCAGDAELRREVETLLQSGQDLELLDQAAADRPSVMAMVQGVTIGSQIGVFRIDALLGVGGMGEVYRARDTKLNRDVAIKILPSAVATDPERLARFKREAQVLASLNHPNIAAIHGFEDSSAVHALVMELVDGPTLAELLQSRNPDPRLPTSDSARRTQGLPIEEALRIARQIADALEAAHEQGIIHRDLKPANIKVREDGTVKVLDFGLAKFADPALPAPDARAPMLSHSPTVTTPAMTAAGVILGTAAYMSPEQAKGKPADKRSDVWAFGCVLYEMLSGTRAFTGDDVAETLAEVIKGAPDWTRLPNLTPSVRLVVERALEKDRRKRIADASTIQLLLSQPDVVRPAAVPPMSRVRRGVSLITAAISGALLLAAIGFATRSSWLPRPPAPLVNRFALTLSPNLRFTNTGRQALAISPDGRWIAYTVNQVLSLKAMGERDARPVSDGNAAIINPIFSPDSQSLAFWSSGSIKRIPVTGGTPIVIANTPLTVLGMSWAEEGFYFCEPVTGSTGNITRLRRVPRDGGPPATLVETGTGENLFGPWALPGGRGVLVTLAKGIASSRWDQAQVLLVLPSGERRVLLEGASDPRYLPTGHLAYSVGGVVFARKFDLNTLTVSGSPVPILEGVGRGFPTSSASQYSVSESGTLVFIPGLSVLNEVGRILAIFGVDGSRTPLGARADEYEFPRVSHDQARIAVGINNDRDASIWTYELAGSTDRHRITLEGRNRFPIWSADDKRLTFQSDRGGDLSIWWQAADGSGKAERLTTAPAGAAQIPSLWTRDGTQLLYEETKENHYALWSWSLATRRVKELIETESPVPLTPTLSADERWLLYHAQNPEGGYLAGQRGNRVWIRPFPIDESRYEVSADGTSHHPVWINGGHDVMYVYGAGLIGARTIDWKTVPVPGNPRQLNTLSMPTLPPAAEARTFDVLRDGRIVADSPQDFRPAGGPGATAVTGIDIVQNWFEELRAKGLLR